MAYDLVTGDTLPSLDVSIVDSAGAPFDLTGATVTLASVAVI